MPVTANKQPDTMPVTANEHKVHNDNEGVQHAATQSEATDPVQSASDKLHAALHVLQGVQTFRYNRTHAALRETMRQTALAAIRDAITDLHEVKRMQ